MRTIVILITSILLAACGGAGPANSTGSPEAVRAFYVGLAALQVGDDVRAKVELTNATQLAPDEPAAWANLGILQLRHKDFEASAQSLERARTLADKEPRIYETIALLEKQRGDFDASQVNLVKAIELDPNNVKAIYALAKEKERQTDDVSARGLYEQILRIKPDNIETQIEAARLAAKQNDVATVKRVTEAIGANAAGWTPEIGTQFDALKSVAASGDTRETITQLSYLRNILLRDLRFRESLDEVRYSETTVGRPFIKPLTLPVPAGSPAAADTTLAFEPNPTAENALWGKFFYADSEGPAVVASGNKTETRIGDISIPYSVETAEGIAAFDFDYDSKNDIALAGTRGFRLFSQQDGSFVDVTAETRLGPEIVDATCSGVWSFDVESDGDLDLALAQTAGELVVLQNNADGSFSKLEPFEQAKKIKDILSFDVDEDGDADVVTLDVDENLGYFSNERGGIFIRQDELHKSVHLAAAFTSGDVDNDGSLDLVAMRDSGVGISGISSVSHDPESNGFKSRLSIDGPGQFCTVAEVTSEVRRPDGSVRETHSNSIKKNCSILLADLDNNGAVDLVLANDSESVILLGVGEGGFVSAETKIAGRVSGMGDFNSDGRIDLVGIVNGVATTFLNKGTKNYNWQTVRLRAAKTTGDQRVNSFGIGGELELRAGSLLQKRLITEPVVHFGLGENQNADVLRVVWQNGSVQAEFDLKPNQTIAAEQRLKGSCPHLFAFDGESFKFVKDAAPWSPALGLKINAQETFGILETEEWFKVPGDALKPTKENYYELRITGEYWESFYLDHYSLLVVDHPENSEAFVDERFAIPPAPLEVFTTGRTREFASAKSDKGEDVSSVVRTLDEKYLDGFDRGTFQGVAADHFVELELPADAPVDKKTTIVADGWVHPTDASINVQLGQSSKERPRSLSLEVRDTKGDWKVAKENLGLPAGKMKTVLIDIPIGTRAIRLRTNMEIFWDRLAWAVYENGDRNKTTRLELAASELRYRGFSVIEKKDDSSPEIPDYHRLLTTNQRWRDMEGYFTRFGEVRELLTRIDGRFVLANAGDELVMKFPAMPPVPAGYKRDFVLIGNGWIKDGDLNSVFSKTLLPLPTHATTDYSKPPTTLENDPVYQKNKADWLNFHTRYVSPDGFRDALR